MARKSVSSAHGARAAKSVGRTRREKPIDFSDIPELTPTELAGMRRVGRPPIGDETRQLIAIRIDPGVLAAFRKEAERRNVGYQTLIHEVLANHVKRVA